MGNSRRRWSADRGFVLGVLLATACASKNPVELGAFDDDASSPGPGDDATVDDDASPGAVFGGGDAGKGSTSRTSCPGGGHTTVSGTVYAPNGTMPLYNVIVYAPAEALRALPTGATCEQCGSLDSMKAYATALSDARGHFVLVDPPAGKNVPLVVQVGKWRRSVTVPEIKACVDNVLTDPELTRLPRNRHEGNLPKIGVTTGGADSIPCMLPKTGIDLAEFGVDGSTAVTLFAGGGGLGPSGIQPARTLWDHADTMKKFDLLIFSCEGTEAVGSASSLPFGLGGTKDATSFAAMTQYLDSGGRIFGTDFQYTVWKDSPDANLSSAATIPGGAPGGGSDITLDTTFPKGKALADWVANLDPSQRYGTISLDVVFDNVSSAKSGAVQVWGRGTDSSGAPTTHPRFMTINTPVGQPASKQCGKAVHLDAHVNQSDLVSTDYPRGCTSKLSTAEKLFAFFFFDLASCIQSEDAPPAPPTPIVPK